MYFCSSYHLKFVRRDNSECGSPQQVWVTDLLGNFFPNSQTIKTIIRRFTLNPRGTKNVSFGYSRIVHTDLCTFTLVFSHENKSRAGKGAP